MSETLLPDHRSAFIALGGGTLVAVGAVLPWLSLFAGLHRYSGITGLYGQLALAGGILAALGGVVLFVRPDRLVRVVVGGLGAGLALFAAWILFGLRETLHHLSDHAMLVARPGPGVFVVLAGALVVAALMLPDKRRIPK